MKRWIRETRPVTYINQSTFDVPMYVLDGVIGVYRVGRSRSYEVLHLGAQKNVGRTGTRASAQAIALLFLETAQRTGMDLHTADTDKLTDNLRAHAETWRQYLEACIALRT